VRRVGTDAQIDRSLVRKGGLYRFVKLAWDQVETTPFVDSWHIKVICQTLERVHYGEIDRLIINIPPACSKSLIVSVFWPAWSWTLEPDLRWMFASHDPDLALRDSRKTKELLESDWFKERWGEDVELTSAEEALEDEFIKAELDHTGKVADTAGLHFTTARGIRMAFTIGGKGVGWHAHRQVVDDPIKPIDAAAASSAALKKVENWWTGTMATRKADPKRFARVIIMQRVHHKDLAGLCIAQGGWYHLCLPMEFASDHKYRSPEDPRTEEGELLCEARYDGPEVAKMRNDMGHHVATAQFDQLPAPPGGGVFHTEWWREWTELPSRGTVWLQSWDHTFGSLEDEASYVVGQVWCNHMADSYLVHQVRARMEFPDMLRAMEALSALFPQALTKLVEAKAAGTSVEQQLRIGYRDETGKLHQIPGIVMIKADRSTGGKLARAQSTTGLWDSGNVWIPAEQGARLPSGKPHPCPWVPGLKERFEAFTGAGGDVADEIDAASQALIHSHGTGAARFARTMQAAAESRRASV
jgi:predicted phage terminase large subunit-like protein